MKAFGLNFVMVLQVVGAPDYEKYVKHPMDLGTVLTRLNKGRYSCLADIDKDIVLTFNNCLAYNGSDSEYGQVRVLTAFIDGHMIDKEFECVTYSGRYPHAAYLGADSKFNSRRISEAVTGVAIQARRHARTGSGARFK
jgi:DNA-directed RNA polymerase